MENKGSKIFLYLVVIGGLIIALFWNDLVELTNEGFTSVVSSSAADDPILNSDFQRVKEVRFEGEHNNISQIKVDELKIIEKSQDTATISVRIASKGRTNDFPWLRVDVISSEGIKLRAVEFAPSEYAREGLLIVETVQLHIQLKPGDASFTVSAFYKGAI